jgi:hypothetical protein
MEQGEDHISDAELHQARAELQLIQDGEEFPADASFHAVLEVTRSQRATFYRFRATVSLSHLLKTEGNAEEASRMLSELYVWFAEGVATADI